MNDHLTDYGNIVMNSVQLLLNDIMSSLPAIIGAIIVLIIGWIIAKILSTIVLKVLKAAKFESVLTKMNIDTLLEKLNLEISPSKVVSKVFYYFILLVFIIAATDIMGWNMVSKEIAKLLTFIPKIVIALIIFMIGYFIANLVRDVVGAATTSLGSAAGGIITSIIYYFLLFIITVTSLTQAGMDTTLITDNFIMIIGTILIASGLAYGLAARDVMTNMLSSFMNKSKFDIGQYIILSDVAGEIVEMDNVSVTLDTGNELVIIPSKRLITETIKVRKEQTGSAKE